MSYLFLWVGHDPMRHREPALAHLRRQVARGSTQSSPAMDSSEWHLLIVHGSERCAASMVQHGRRASLRALAACGHAWPRSGPGLQDTLPAANLLPVAEARSLRERFDGVFAFSIVDVAGERVAIGSDVLGTFHLYWRVFDDGVAVSSSSRFLASITRTDLDPIGVQEFVSSGTPNEDRSLWQGVQKLRGSQILLIDRNGRTALEPHRPLLSLLHEPVRGLEASVAELHRAIGSVLSRLTTSGRPIVDVTGGNDSRALAAAMVAHGHRFTSTVTGSPDQDDVRISAALAEAGGWPHSPRQPFEPPTFGSLLAAIALTDGEYDAFEFSGIAGVHRCHMSEGFALSLNGSYGETGRGYPWRLGPKALVFGSILSSRLTSREPIDAREQSIRRFRTSTGLLFAEPARLDWAAHGAAMVQRMMDSAPGLPQCAHLDLIHIDLRMERWQGRIASSTNHLWPAVSPWGFQDCLSVLLTAHPRARRNSLLTRAYTQYAAPRLAEVPLFTGNPAMPFTWRNALKFLPAISYYVDRARAKSGLGRIGSVSTPRSMQDRFAPTFHDSPLDLYLREPMLAESRLFDTDALMDALDPDRIREGADTATWCRLVTLELLLREHAGSDVECCPST